MDCVAPPRRRGGDAIHQCSRADSWLLRGIFARAMLLWPPQTNTSPKTTSDKVTVSAADDTVITCAFPSAVVGGSACLQVPVESDVAFKAGAPSSEVPTAVPGAA